MQFRKFKEEEPKLGITPLIDIVFLLLIFFMLTSHFHIASGVHIQLPKVTQEAPNKEEYKIIVVVDREGHIFLKGERIKFEELGLKLQNLVKENGLVQLFLEADKDIRHGKVVRIMDIAKSSGVSSIIIAARWEPEKVF